MNPPRILSVALLLAVLVGCASPSPTPVIPDHPWEPTIADNPRFSEDILRRFYDDDQWRTVSRMRYSGFVTFDALVGPDRTVRIRGVREAWPDRKREAFAERLTERVRLSPVTVGTRVPPSALVHVIFYEVGEDTMEAVVFAEQRASAVPHGRAGGDTFLRVFSFRGANWLNVDLSEMDAAPSVLDQAED